MIFVVHTKELLLSFVVSLTCTAFILFSIQ